MFYWAKLRNKKLFVIVERTTVNNKKCDFVSVKVALKNNVSNDLHRKRKLLILITLIFEIAPNNGNKSEASAVRDFIL